MPAVYNHKYSENREPEAVSFYNWDLWLARQIKKAPAGYHKNRLIERWEELIMDKFKIVPLPRVMKYLDEREKAATSGSPS